MKNKILSEEQLMTCRLCLCGFDLSTEDPLRPGICRDCGDKSRAAESHGYTSKIENRTPKQIPSALVAALLSQRLNYSRIRTVFYCCCISVDDFCGVAGDGDNAAYEWFVWRDGKLETSDVGYGDTLVALRDVLSAQIP